MAVQEIETAELAHIFALLRRLISLCVVVLARSDQLTREEGKLVDTLLDQLTECFKRLEASN